MTLFTLSNAALAGILILLVYAIKRAGVKEEAIVPKGYSKYAVARYELSKRKYDKAAETMYLFLNTKVKKSKDPKGVNGEEVLKDLKKISNEKNRNIDLIKLGRKYLSLLEKES